MWTNTCCSHPEHTPSEMETDRDWIGPRLAAQRRTQFELGIGLDLLDLHCGARILYEAPADETFMEYELDYIIFAKVEAGGFELNPTEVMATEYVGLRDLDDFLADKARHGEQVTPWFKLIKNSKLPEWWARLEAKGSFPMEAETILRYM